MIIDFIYGQGGGSGSGVTPEEVQEQIQSALTEYTPTSGFSTINGSAITEGEAIVIDEPDLSNYWDSAQTESAISAATSGKADKPLRETYPLAVSTLRINAGNYDLVLNGDYGQNIGNIWAPSNNGQAGQILVARGGQISPVWSAVTFISSADVQSQIDTKAADYTPTTGFSTINGSAITDGSALIIDAGAGSESVVELTQAQYDALSAYAPDTTYIITDAQSINMDDYATTAETSALSADIATISGDVATKATKASVTANTNRQFPKWNAEGIITGTTGNAIYERYLNVNGSNQSVLRISNSDFGPVYAPTTAGSAGQPVLSNGSGAPVWGAKAFAFISQTDYDNLPTKDANTIYFITGD